MLKADYLHASGARSRVRRAGEARGPSRPSCPALESSKRTQRHRSAFSPPARPSAFIASLLRDRGHLA